MDFHLPAELIDKYVSRRHEDLKTCISALSNGDFATIEIIGHRLKGNGSSFGFPELDLLGAQLELAARSAKRDCLREEIGNLEKWLESHSV